MVFSNAISIKDVIFSHYEKTIIIWIQILIWYNLNGYNQLIKKQK